MEAGMNDLDPFKIFLELQLGLSRNGPGSRASTEAAFALSASRISSSSTSWRGGAAGGAASPLAMRAFSRFIWRMTRKSAKATMVNCRIALTNLP